MTIILFIIGLLTCITCGKAAIEVPADWKRELVWVFGGMIGATMMGFAVLVSAGWTP